MAMNSAKRIRRIGLAAVGLAATGVMVFGAIVGLIVTRVIRTVGLSFVDRFLGACFGLARGALLCIAMLIALTAFGPHSETGSRPDAVVHSRIAPWLLEASRVGVAIAPMELKQTFRKYYAEVRQSWKQRT